MALGTIPDEFQLQPIVSPNQKVAFVDSTNGHLTSVGRQQLAQVRDFLTGTSRRIPVSVTGSANALVLNLTPGGPLVQGYFDFDTYAGVAATTSTGAVTALVRLPSATSGGTQDLATLKVFKQNGAAQASTGDLTAGLQYEFTFADNLDGGNGGFVLR